MYTKYRADPYTDLNKDFRALLLYVIPLWFLISPSSSIDGDTLSQLQILACSMLSMFIGMKCHLVFLTKILVSGS